MITPAAERLRVDGAAGWMKRLAMKPRRNSSARGVVARRSFESPGIAEGVANRIRSKPSMQLRSLTLTLSPSDGARELRSRRWGKSLHGELEQSPETFSFSPSEGEKAGMRGPLYGFETAKRVPFQKPTGLKIGWRERLGLE